VRVCSFVRCLSWASFVRILGPQVSILPSIEDGVSGATVVHLSNEGDGGYLHDSIKVSDVSVDVILSLILYPVII